MKEYIKYKIDQTGMWAIVEYYKGEKISGGPTIAYFHDERLADEYIYYKTSQLPKSLEIKQGLFIDGKTIKATE